MQFTDNCAYPCRPFVSSIVTGFVSGLMREMRVKLKFALGGR